jgi:hypothetical protein
MCPLPFWLPSGTLHTNASMICITCCATCRKSTYALLETGVAWAPTSCGSDHQSCMAASSATEIKILCIPVSDGPGNEADGQHLLSTSFVQDLKIIVASTTGTMPRCTSGVVTAVADVKRFVLSWQLEQGWEWGIKLLSFRARSSLTRLKAAPHLLVYPTPLPSAFEHVSQWNFLFLTALTTAHSIRVITWSWSTSSD